MRVKYTILRDTYATLCVNVFVSPYMYTVIVCILLQFICQQYLFNMRIHAEYKSSWWFQNDDWKPLSNQLRFILTPFWHDFCSVLEIINLFFFVTMYYNNICCTIIIYVCRRSLMSIYDLSSWKELLIGRGP